MYPYFKCVFIHRLDSQISPQRVFFHKTTSETEMAGDVKEVFLKIRLLGNMFPRWWFQICFFFNVHPKIGEDAPILTSIFLKRG